MRRRSEIFAAVIVCATMQAAGGRAAPPDALMDDEPPLSTVVDPGPPSATESAAVALGSTLEEAARSSLEAVSAAGRAAMQFGWEISFALGFSVHDAARVEPTSPLVDREVSPAAPTAAKPHADAAGVVAATPEPAEPADPLVQPDVPVPPPAPVAETAAPNPEILAYLMDDVPRRESDGSYFVPKALQRLLDVRTVRAAAGDHPITIRLPGRIISDPNAHGLAETSISGRVEAAENGLPVLGQHVRKGDVLAYVSPSIGVVDRTQIRRDVARLTTDIRGATENLEILQKFWFVPFREGKIVQARMHLEGLRRERAALLPLLDTREVLRAPTDGVVSAVHAAVGQVLEPGETAFEIVNPGHMWIEASAADPDEAALAAAASRVGAVTLEGHPLALRFVGTGLSVQQQAALLHYAIDTPIGGLRVGRPVTVYAESRERSRTGIAVPHESVVNGPGGVDEVWEHVDAEHFRPRPVRTEALDGVNVLITQGLSPDTRVVVRSARLLAQYQ